MLVIDIVSNLAPITSRIYTPSWVNHSAAEYRGCSCLISRLIWTFQHNPTSHLPSVIISNYFKLLKTFEVKCSKLTNHSSFPGPTRHSGLCSLHKLISYGDIFPAFPADCRDIRPTNGSSSRHASFCRVYYWINGGFRVWLCHPNTALQLRNSAEWPILYSINSRQGRCMGAGWGKKDAGDGFVSILLAELLLTKLNDINVLELIEVPTVRGRSWRTYSLLIDTYPSRRWCFIVLYWPDSTADIWICFLAFCRLPVWKRSFLWYPLWRFLKWKSLLLYCAGVSAFYALREVWPCAVAGRIVRSDPHFIFSSFIDHCFDTDTNADQWISRLLYSLTIFFCILRDVQAIFAQPYIALTSKIVSMQCCPRKVHISPCQVHNGS